MTDNPHPKTTKLIYALIKRRVATPDASIGLSAACLERIESGETPRRDVVFLLRARDAAIQRARRERA